MEEITNLIENLKSKNRHFVNLLYTSIIRHGFDNTGLTKSKIMFSNVLLHIQPVKIHKRSVKFKTTLGLGLITTYMFFVLAVTGIILMFHYSPSAAIGPDGFPDAYSRMLNLRSNIFWGDFMRNMHRWAAHGMVAFVALHMLRVYLTGAHRGGREFNWVIGCILGLLTVFLSYTGYLLPWDQLAFWGVKVGTEIARLAPGGDIIRGILLGDTDVSGEALLRFYVLHVAVLPTIMGSLIAWHFWRIRKDGGLARPADTSDEKQIPDSDFGEVKNNSIFKSTRSYKLVELVKGNEPKVNEEVDQMMFAWPKLIIRELIVLAGVLAFLSLISVYFDAPLEPPADPANPTNPAKAPWYFLGLQELTSYDGFIGGIVIPGILAGGVMVLPYIEMFFETFTKTYRKNIPGVWFAKERTLENALFIGMYVFMAVLIVIGVYFRGANWEIVYPWIPVTGGGH
jgi:quinol-cytochrome oxidoreductase complex cytochrome b subunit